MTTKYIASFTSYDTDIKSIQIKSCNYSGYCSTGIEVNIIYPESKKIPCSYISVLNNGLLEYNNIIYSLYGIKIPINDLTIYPIDNKLESASILANSFLKDTLNTDEYCDIQIKNSSSQNIKSILLIGEKIGSINEEMLSKGYAVVSDNLTDYNFKNSYKTIQEKSNKNYNGLWFDYCKLMEYMSDSFNLCNHKKSNVFQINLIQKEDSFSYYLFKENNISIQLKSNLSNIKTNTLNNVLLFNADYNISPFSISKVSFSIENSLINSKITNIIDKNTSEISIEPFDTKLISDINIYYIENGSINIEYEINLDNIFQVN